ncbi:phospholipase effector Tle1 domain-containing protein [Apibacter sp. ESL0404]|uniref:phospholipase effector Tle1 domain-containing protein n=1 Tax=Apibacter sp. ESL0404 TaxID=2704651 RepID=UPI001C6A736F|nr:DUF2235 domain-containing protein [Apibacter sp. ESL0404]QYN50686.1 DUF2235 domain-containing protein [Apibacter sp. ESL0404]
MGKTFVFNSGEARSEPGELQLTYGLFFDGTLNNRENTRIWKKVRGIDGYGNPTKEEIEIFEQNAQEKKFLSRKRVDKESTSYLNDFTNVGRKSLSCNREYTIYVEGIGTQDKKEDKLWGYALGRGETGIQGKVTNGCETLAEKITEFSKKFKRGNIQFDTILITVDVFGFSRGAAAARYFAYNIQKLAYPAKVKNGRYYDHEGKEVPQAWVKNGKLPRMGNLGTALLKKKISHELIDNTFIHLRFLGIYDTVVSYDPDTWLLPNFKSKISKLHLDELGRPQKIVHFTSLDEHREYFPLTRIKPGTNRIERNFPGVHSDIGGSYSNYTETGSENLLIEKRSKYELEKLIDYRAELIQGGWYTPEQLKIEPKMVTKHSHYSLKGERNLRKEYSYIFLHLMREESEPYMGKYYMPGEMEKYSLSGNKILEQAKEYLQLYTMKWNEDWVLKSEKEEKKLNQATSTKEIKENHLNQADKKILTETNHQPIEKELEEIYVTDSDRLLKKIRNYYLHWSSHWGELGNTPNKSRKREYYNADGTVDTN